MNIPNIKPLHKVLLSVFVFTFIWSYTKPHDYLTWFLEVIPVIIGLGVIMFTYNRFKLSDLVYILITIMALIMLVGGHYTYERVPLFNWLRDTLHFARNHYDRFGHFMQGFGVALIVREILVRKTPLKSGMLRYLLVISVCMFLSSSYELIEWGFTVGSGGSDSAFLGTQGDKWDTQWDMFMALLGANIGLILFRVPHDRSMKKDGLIR